MKASYNNKILTCEILGTTYTYQLSLFRNPDPMLEFKNKNGNLSFAIPTYMSFPNDVLESEEFANRCCKEVVKFLIDRESNYKARNQLRLLIYDYNWENVKDRNIDTIGAYWQCGVATGTVESHLMYFGYTCSCNRNENFFTIYEISEGLYNKIKTDYVDYLGSAHKYAKAPNDIENEIIEMLKKYGTIIYEGWNKL